MMVLFSAKHPSEVKEAHCEELRALGFPIDSCVDPLPAFAAEAPEGPAADAPPDGAGALDDDERSGEFYMLMTQKIKFPKELSNCETKPCLLSTGCFTSPRTRFVIFAIKLACFPDVFAGSHGIQRLNLIP